MLTKAGPSKIFTSTGGHSQISLCVVCEMLSVISDLLFAGLRLPFSDRDGGKDWFLCAKTVPNHPAELGKR